MVAVGLLEYHISMAQLISVVGPSGVGKTALVQALVKAHPFETAAPSIHEDAITWEDWQVKGYTGLELWNGLSEIKTLNGNNRVTLIAGYNSTDL